MGHFLHCILVQTVAAIGPRGCNRFYSGKYVSNFNYKCRASCLAERAQGRVKLPANFRDALYLWYILCFNLIGRLEFSHLVPFSNL